MTIDQQVGFSSTPPVEGRWRDQASCRFVSPELFFPTGSTGPAIEEIRTAKAVCHGCHVQRECLQFALETNQEAGIWGGTTEDERRRLRRSSAAVAVRRTRVSA